MSQFPRLLALLFALALIGTPTFAQAAQAGSHLSAADVKEMHDYTLTMPKLQKMAAATTALMEFGKRHPEIDEASNAKTIDQMVSKLQKYPEAVAAVRQSGMSPREYAVCFLTFMQASIAVAMKKSGAYNRTPPEILQSVSQANLDFTDQHWSEIQALMPKSSDDE